ncbi:MAG: hypothetical protein WKF30_05220, partial [Pyrinomonadaceae bacterium]
MGRRFSLMRKTGIVAFLLIALIIAGARSGLTQQRRASPPPPPPPSQKGAPETLIRNATVLTVSRGTLPATDILIRNGKIAAVGQNLKAEASARIIDATSKYILPGIIDAHSHSMMDTINEFSLSVTSMTRIQDVLNPTDVDLYR